MTILVISISGYPDSKVHGANMGPIWALSAPDGPHVGLMKLAIRVSTFVCTVNVITNDLLVDKLTMKLKEKAFLFSFFAVCVFVSKQVIWWHVIISPLCISRQNVGMEPVDSVANACAWQNRHFSIIWNAILRQFAAKACVSQCWDQIQFKHNFINLIWKIPLQR